MTKGCQKRIYYMKNPGGKYFEEAYLILKKDVGDRNGYAAPDLATEAERIVSGACDYFAPRKKDHLIGRAGAFALGAASSSALIGAVALIVGLG